MQSPTLMGIVNVTPDSFSDGGQFISTQRAVDHALMLVEEGATILDIGGESTRPGADAVDADEEAGRVLPVIEQLSAQTDVPISIDTRKPLVAKAAVNAGASIWNDVSALTYDATSLETAAGLGIPVILMHAQGDPKTMQQEPSYRDVVTDVTDFLADRRRLAIEAGVDPVKIILDPGIGFGKTLDHNLALMASFDRLLALGSPVLLGASRKRFIAALDRAAEPDTRVGGSIAAVLAAREQGVSWFRVHDVAATRQALNVWDAVRG